MTDVMIEQPDEALASADTPADHAYLDDYIREAARQLKVGDWTIDLPHDVFCDDGAHGTVQFTIGKCVALIRFGTGFLERSREQQRHTIAHELVHIHLNAMEDAFNTLSPQLAQPTYTVAWSSFNRHLEEATDQLASVLAPSLPLPPERPSR